VMLRTLCAVVPALLVGAPALAQPGGGPPPAKVRLDSARMETVEQRRDVTGEIRAVRRSSLAAEEPGLVRSITVEAGDVVSAGQVLATLDDELLTLQIAERKAQVDSSQASVQEREAQAAKAERDLSRLKELQARQSASQNEVDDAVTTLAEAKARLANARAELAAREALLSWLNMRQSKMSIRSPMNGRVVSRGVDVGEWVREGDAIVELLDLSELDAYVDVPERFIAPLRSDGAKVQLRIAATNDEFDAPVSAVIAEGDRLARTFPVRIRLDNAKGRWRPGMSVIGQVATGVAIEALTVHKDAILRDDVGAYVFFDANGAAMRAPVETLFGVGDRVAIRSQMLRPDTRVVIEGNERIYFPGQPLMDMDNPAPPGPPPGAGGPPGARPGS